MSLASMSALVRSSFRRGRLLSAHASVSARQCHHTSQQGEPKFPEDSLPKLDVCTEPVNIKASFSIFQNQCYIDIRKYFVNEEGRTLPTRKGIRLSVRQWEVIKANQKLIDQKLSELNEKLQEEANEAQAGQT